MNLYRISYNNFIKAADNLYQAGLMDTIERAKIPHIVEGVLKVYSKAVPKAVFLPTSIIAQALHRAVIENQGKRYITAGRQSGNKTVQLLTDLIALGFKLEAADTGAGVPITDDEFPNPRGPFTSQITALTTMAISDENHAISFYTSMIEALGVRAAGEDDPNVAVLEELKFDEQVHERVLLRMLGNDLPILGNPPEEPTTSGESDPGYKKVEQSGKFFASFNDLINTAIGDERHAIAVYCVMLEAMATDDPNNPVITKIATDEQDHQMKLLRMLGEKTPEPVEAA